MRKIGEHLGYEHAGTLNHDKVKNFIMGGAGAEEEIEEMTPEDYTYSQPIMDAKERVSKFQEDRMSGALYHTHTENDSTKVAAASQMRSNKKKGMGEHKLD